MKQERNTDRGPSNPAQRAPHDYHSAGAGRNISGELDRREASSSEVELSWHYDARLGEQIKRRNQRRQST